MAIVVRWFHLVVQVVEHGISASVAGCIVVSNKECSEMLESDVVLGQLSFHCFFFWHLVWNAEDVELCYFVIVISSRLDAQCVFWRSSSLYCFADCFEERSYLIDSRKGREISVSLVRSMFAGIIDTAPTHRLAFVNAPGLLASILVTRYCLL